MNKKSLNTVIKSIADSVNKIRVCDSWRLYESAMTAGCLPLMKQVMKEKRPDVFGAMIDYEKEEYFLTVNINQQQRKR